MSKTSVVAALIREFSRTYATRTEGGFEIRLKIHEQRGCRAHISAVHVPVLHHVDADVHEKKQKACEVMLFVEEIDSVSLTVEERLAMSCFLDLLASNVNYLSFGHSMAIGSLMDLGLDWYMSATCSKEIVREPENRQSITMYVNTSTTLSKIFIGIMNFLYSIAS
ncbi:hypothetical protein NX059_012215 [Plenodomus lindquistii]|nr:hypothetical protein NX059_012215 [Plenodomus lindquistii]